MLLRIGTQDAKNIWMMLGDMERTGVQNTCWKRRQAPTCKKNQVERRNKRLDLPYNSPSLLLPTRYDPSSIQRSPPRHVVLPLQEPQKRHALHHSFICCAIHSKHPHSNPCTTISHAPFVRIPIGKLKYQPCKTGEEAGTLEAIQPPNCICPSQRELNDR